VKLYEFVRRLKNKGITDPYTLWVQKYYPMAPDIVKMRQEIAKFGRTPLISIVMPTYNTDHQFLREAIGSVRDQAYENWELIIIDDASKDADVRGLIEEFANTDPRIKYEFLEENLHIAGATNRGFALAEGEFVCLFDHDDRLWPNALYEVVKVANKHPDIDFIYTDEDKISENSGEHFGAYFKPDWNFEFLRGINYITHFAAVRRSIIDEVGGENTAYNGSQDWEFFLRITRRTNKVYHIPKVLYSWRVHLQSTAQSFDAKPYLIEAQRRALTDDLTARGFSNFEVIRDEKNNGWNTIFGVEGSPKVSIVIPTKDSYDIIKRCLESIFEKSTYSNFEVILVDSGSTDENVRKLYAEFEQAHPNFKAYDYVQEKFSYAKACNYGADKADGTHLLMLNNDTEVITPDWIEQLLGDSERPDIGAIGVLLLFPGGDIIQHGGVTVGVGGVASNSFTTLSQTTYPFSVTQHTMIFNRRESSAVTAACLMIKKALYDEVGGFDPEFAVTYNDVDLCLRLLKKGYKNLYNPYVQLIHHESISLGKPEEVAKRDNDEFNAAVELFTKRYPDFLERDPNFNANLDRTNPFYVIDPNLNQGNSE
jgi:GT2 family glycosyltransferase